MDNAGSHKTSLLRFSGWGLRFLPPYSPQLNQIEEYFSMLKSRYSTVNPRAQTRNDLKSILKTILEGNDFETPGYFRNMIKLIDKGISGKQFM